MSIGIDVKPIGSGRKKLYHGLRPPEPCPYCTKDGKPDGEPLGYTLILGNPVTCPMCHGRKVVE